MHLTMSWHQPSSLLVSFALSIATDLLGSSQGCLKWPHYYSFHSSSWTPYQSSAKWCCLSPRQQFKHVFKYNVGQIVCMTILFPQQYSFLLRSICSPGRSSIQIIMVTCMGVMLCSFSGCLVNCTRRDVCTLTWGNSTSLCIDCCLLGILKPHRKTLLLGSKGPEKDI